jgi:arylsulfatase A-like enzyme
MKSVKHITRLALIFGLGLKVIAAPTAPPNLIVILTEDQGYHDVGFHGSKDIRTPNLDSIASNGVHFASGYIAAGLYSPSLAGLLTGRYPGRFGFERDPNWQPANANIGLPLTEKTLADVLAKVGYHNGVIGQWNLGYNSELHPLQRGFDEFFGFLGPGHTYLLQEATNKVGEVKTEEDSYRLPIFRNHDLVKTTNYLTDDLSDEAVRFIQRNKAKPFFLCVAYNAPHTPLQATEKYAKRFPRIQAPLRRNYAAMISAVDDGVGRILAELRQAGLEEQTLVVYISGSGGALDQSSSDNYPLRGVKNTPWEAGWRVPFVMQWPGHIPKGITYEPPVLSLDIFATIAALTEASVNSDRPLDGVNLMPYLTGQKNGIPHETIFFHSIERGTYAVRSGEYKLVIPNANQPAQLFNLVTDISETKNLAEAKPEVLQALEEKRLAWVQQMTTSQVSAPKQSSATKKESPSP